MVLNAAVQMLREADDLKQKISKFKCGTTMLQDRSIWVTQQQLQQVYQKVLVLDLDYALEKKVEQDLWNVGFKQQIEALQAITKDKKNPLRNEAQAMLTWVLHAAAGFYLCLLHQICTTFKLDLPFRRRASLLGWAEGWGAGSPTQAIAGVLPPPAAARYISQHCLVHLGDLARYRQQLRVAHTFYRHALLVSAQSGQPYNQLALVARRRGRQLEAIYWHVRSLLVRAPFPPAHANLATTLAAAANTRVKEDLPVIPGVTSPSSEPNTTVIPSRLDAHSFVDEFIKAVHLIHTLEDLETAAQIVKSLNSSLTPLVAMDSFECMTLIKFSCIIIWLVHSNTEGLTLESSQLTDSERRAGSIALELATGVLIALLLPAYTRQLNKPAPALPSLKVWLEWLLAFPPLLKSATLTSRPQLWAALAHTLNQLGDCVNGFDDKMYATIPLPEDEELNGFLPLESALSALKFTNYASWDTYGDRIPAYPKHTDGEDDNQDDMFSLRCPSDVTEETLSKQPELEHRLRASRLINLGIQVAKNFETNGQDHFTVAKEEDKTTFNALSVDSGELAAALMELSFHQTYESESDDPSACKAPKIISEADFRERVRKERVGILKPQGSLERAREERALATQDEVEVEGEDSGDDSKKESRKPRMNVAMAAIMRKQEETNKQVKFVTPASTPDSLTSDASQVKEEKPKILQPLPRKSLANLPVGRKTGGILSLKDKSAGYPHLVNAEPEVKVKPEEDKKPDIKPIIPQQNHPKLSQEHHSTPPNTVPNFNQRTRFPNYPYASMGTLHKPGTSAAPHGIKLAVVNPKEIDVRAAAVQRQNARQESFHDARANPQMSGDKQNFLNDLPPRFANQYRYWQHHVSPMPQQMQEQNSKYFNARDLDMMRCSPSNIEQMNGNMMDFNRSQFHMKGAHNDPVPSIPQYSLIDANYRGLDANRMQHNIRARPNHYEPGVGPPPLLPSPPPMSSYGTYGGNVGYDSSMYPQFANNNQPPMEHSRMSFMAGVPHQEERRETPISFNMAENEAAHKRFNGIMEPPSNTYSLFSAQGTGNWTPPQLQQSLWSGPGPSPLERLLEQQRHGKPPNEPQ